MSAFSQKIAAARGRAGKNAPSQAEATRADPAARPSPYSPVRKTTVAAAKQPPAPTAPPVELQPRTFDDSELIKAVADSAEGIEQLTETTRVQADRITELEKSLTDVEFTLTATVRQVVDLQEALELLQEKNPGNALPIFDDIPDSADVGGDLIFPGRGADEPPDD